MIKYVTGDVTDAKPRHPDETIIIPHVLSETGAYDAGVAAAIANKWPSARSRWRELLIDTCLVHGSVQLVDVSYQYTMGKIVIANILGQYGLRGPGNSRPLSYKALYEALEALATKYKSIRNRGHNDVYQFHMPRLGCGLAGGSWDKVEHIVNQTLSDFEVTVYDLPPK